MTTGTGRVRFAVVAMDAGTPDGQLATGSASGEDLVASSVARASSGRRAVSSLTDSATIWR